MSDNQSVNVNTGAPGAVNVAIASDDIGGVQHPRVKVEFGSEGSAVDVSAANPLPVADATLAARLPDLVGGRLPVDGSGVPQPVTGPLTDAQLRAVAVPVSGTVAVSGTVPVSAASLPLPTGAATQATLASLDGKTPALGQATAAASVPVVIASNQTAVPVSDGGGSLTVDGTVAVSGSVAVTGPLTDTQLRASAVPVSAAALPLPTGASTETTLSAINTKTPALVTGRVPVDGSGVTQPVSAASLPLPTGAATQATLSSVDTKTPALGQALMAASSPVVIASNQSAIPVADGGGSLTVDGTVGISGSVAVTGPLTDAQLRATPVPVSGSFAVAGSVTPSDGAANPTDGQPCVSYLSGFNGATWDRLRSSVAGGLLTECTRIAAHEAAFTPGYDGPSSIAGELNTDPEGHLVIRGPIHTDESSFRVNFAGTSLAVSLGSVTRTGLVFDGGSIGNGTIDLHVGDYIKFDADPETAWAQVESLDGTTATVGAYTGSATTGAASRALMAPTTGTGGSIAVASGACTIGSGTTASAVTGLVRTVDYAPLVHRARFSLSQRIANQTWLCGMEEAAATPRFFARFSASGTTASAIVCETGRNPTGAPSANETQSTTVTLPNGLTTAAAAEYRVELLTERVVFFVDGVLVAEHTRVIPAQHDEMTSVAKWVNGGSAPATNSNAVVDYVTAKNHNKVEIGIMSDAEKLLAAIQPMKEFAYSLAGVIAINTDLLVIDCRQLAAINIQCTSMGTTGVVTPQWSNDPAFSVVVGATVTTPAGADATTFNAAGIWSTPVVARYLRLRLTTATTGGTTTLAVNGSSFPVQTRLATQPVTVSSGTVTTVTTLTGTTTLTPGTGATNLGKAEDAAAASGDVGVFVLGVRRDALTTSASAAGDYGELATDRFGAQLVRSFEKSARSFRAAGQITLAASATDVFDIPGNATTTVVVTRVAVSGTATSASQADMLLVKRSTANSGGTRAALAAVPLDSTDSAASSTPGGYTANPTTGTLVGAVGRQHVGLLTAASGGEVGHEWNFGDKGKGLILSGTAQVLALNLNGVTIAGGVLDVEIDWYEF